MAQHNVNKLFLIVILSVLINRQQVGNAFRLIPSSSNSEPSVPGYLTNSFIGTKWAVLIAGSNGFLNYRHQADVCHAYQVLKKGGLKDENIIVFMYDDIAFNEYNPRPGVIINQPHGPDVYEGVPKDYTGDDVNAENFFNVILGNKTGITGTGSGKVVESGPNDTIFIYYADHGGAGVLGMPNDQIYASDFNDVLKKKYEARGYARMVIYIEACESGSIFDGLLSEELNIYATTAANASQSSYGSYCDGDYPHEAESPYEGICLGDMYSVSWIEDSEKHNLRMETLEEQYKVVKRRVQYDNDYGSSQVKQFGNMAIASDSLFSYIGTNPDNDYYPSVSRSLISTPPKPSRIVSQRDTDIFYLTRMFRNAPKGSKEKLKAHNELVDKMKHRKHVDESMKRIANLLFGSERGKGMLKAVRPAGQPLVDDWECLKSLVRTYEEKCGPLLRYGWKYNRAIANMCNAGLKAEQMGSASDQICGRRALRGVVNNP